MDNGLKFLLYLTCYIMGDLVTYKVASCIIIC